MIDKYESVIVNKLLDKYEKSKSFTGDNRVKQNFTVKIASLFPKYNDHSNYEVFQRVNEAVDVLNRKGIVMAKANPARVYDNVILNVDNLKEAYAYIGRSSKRDINAAIMNLLESYKDRNEILKAFCGAQIERIGSNKSIQFFNEDLDEFKNIMTACEELLKVEQETFVRDFSIRVFKDSKVFEGISTKVVNLLYEYGDFPEKEGVLGILNLIKNPTYVNFKGSGIITLSGQMIDMGKLKSDIAISSAIIEDIEGIELNGAGVITIENLTSFHTFNDRSKLAIYLGGYHNRVRREFIKKLHSWNPDTKFQHFGDIDAGGFYILEHLKRETGIHFEPYKMDVDTLRQYSEYTKKLTENDRERLLRLKDREYSGVIEYMLHNNCKLEQEAIEVMAIEIAE